MDVFELRNDLIEDYQKYVESFIHIRDVNIKEYVQEQLKGGLLWPDPLIQLNPSFEPGAYIEDLTDNGTLDAECSKIFRKGKASDGEDIGERLRLHKHQLEAILIAKEKHNYILTTGTGSGKSLAYIVPIVDFVLRHGSGQGIRAIVVYPMNALANSQQGELTKFLVNGYGEGKSPVTFAKYTGQEPKEERERILEHPPDILLTNYVMLELMLTRPFEDRIIRAAQGLQFLVLDELHTYRGRQGADVAMLVRRVRDRLTANTLQCVGTSATLAGTGTYDEQRANVASVGSRLFGATVDPEHVIGESLERATPDRALDDPTFVKELTARVADEDVTPPTSFQGFVDDPLSTWLEGIFGVRAEDGTGRLIRARPRSISGEQGAAVKLSDLTGVDHGQCVRAIQQGLLGGYACDRNPETGFPPFAFRLHQFIARGDTVYAPVESEEDRYLTVQGQRFVPGDRSRVLLPLSFCRECGQEYYCVHEVHESPTGHNVYEPREISDISTEEDSKAGFLYVSALDPWPSDEDGVIDRLPDDWIEETKSGGLRVRRNRRKDLPRAVRAITGQQADEDGFECHFIPAPFRFCLCCGVSYGARQRSDFGKISSLGSEGRSTATTILSLSVVRRLRQESSLIETARKLLSFTDNRQDASLQAGHFNDFIEIGLLRAALYRAAKKAGPEGIRHEELPQKVFDTLNLPLSTYAVDPDVRFQRLEETQKALRQVLGYRLYRDLRRGWRITSPNLEQCGLLEIQYRSLEDVCHADDVWQNMDPTLVTASPDTRAKIAKVLLDYMRRELAIKVDFLDAGYHEQIQGLSNQHLKMPWALDEQEQLERSTILYPRSSSRDRDYGGNVFLSPLGGFGQYLRRPTTFSNYSARISAADTDGIIRNLLEGLRIAGLVEIVHPPEKEDDVPGYQLPASAMSWIEGDGSKAFQDPIRVPREPEGGFRTNTFFVEFYQTIAASLLGMEAREHTAQVPYPERMNREDRFREADLPILYCSPTMELGVDIAELNVVNMRNIPPTPANYAQRSGRAGRSGQPALVFSYASTGSPHDQYFFRHPDQMVAGAVSPPRLDLSNEDLIRAHIQAIWLAETGQSLNTSLTEIIELGGENPSLSLLDSVRDNLRKDSALHGAQARSKRVLETIQDQLDESEWYHEGWLDEVLNQVMQAFDRACDRWRGLYRAALHQQKLQNAIMLDATRSPDDKRHAQRLRREAEAQLALLTDIGDIMQSDFYSYRYFASEGFLPGYNFPRLPLSAFIPGRRRSNKDEFLLRPRFLAISEFGPRAIVYHEGSRYVINKVILPVGEDSDIATQRAKLCRECGYLHPVQDNDGLDLCERCGNPLGVPLTSLFRMENVATRRRDRISCDEEERMRFGYEIISGIRFSEHRGELACRTANVMHEEADIARISYGHTATLWRVNLGWSKRKERQQYGFALDTERGYWQKSDRIEDDVDDPMSPNVARVIPYVEDRRNCLLLEPDGVIDAGTMASLQSAMKSAIQVIYQLEDNELAAESLPDRDNRRLILLYESAEGGAGVLRHLVDNPRAFANVAREALRICHFDPETGEDAEAEDLANGACEAACYDCLMSYYNQRDHQILDRKAICDILLRYANAEVSSSSGPKPRHEHLEHLLKQCDSDLEREWLRTIDGNDLALPTHAQRFMEACKTRPDFLYLEDHAAVYVDGPDHDYPDRQQRDIAQTEAMEDAGYTVLRFGYQDDWMSVIAKFPYIFGKPNDA
jgi:ATP-dependent helicase YprA (DUF1998 family)/very-short-patch-repair endonuclease